MSSSKSLSELQSVIDIATDEDDDEEKDCLHPDNLRGLSLGGRSLYGPTTCTLTVGGRPDALDRALSVLVWAVLVLGLLASLVLAGSDPLRLGTNFLESLYRYLSVVAYIEALLLVIFKIIYPAKDSVSRVLRFSSRHIPATLISAPATSLRLEGKLVSTGLNAASDNPHIEVLSGLALSLDLPVTTAQQFCSRAVIVLENRVAQPDYVPYTSESVQTLALRFVAKASRWTHREERAREYETSVGARLPSVQIISGNDLILLAIARLAVESNEDAVQLVWDLFQTELRYLASCEGGDEDDAPKEDLLIDVPYGCVLRNVNIAALKAVDTQFEKLNIKAVAEFRQFSIRLGFRRKGPVHPLHIWETAKGTLLVKLPVWKISRNEPVYFVLMTLSLAIYAAIPWLVALLDGEGKYLSRAADAAGIGTAVLAGFAYVAETFWPGQRLLWAAMRGLADVQDVARLSRLLGVPKEEVVRRIVAQGGFFSSAGEEVGSCCLLTLSSPVDTSMCVGGVRQRYETHRVGEENGRVEGIDELVTLSPSRIVCLGKGHEGGVFHEESIKKHQAHAYLYILVNQDSAELKEVWGSFNRYAT